MPDVMTNAFTFAPAIGPTASVTAPNATYGPTGKVGPPTILGVIVGALGSDDAGPLPHPASSSAMETPNASCVVTGLAIGDTRPSSSALSGYGQGREPPLPTSSLPTQIQPHAEHGATRIHEDGG